MEEDAGQVASGVVPNSMSSFYGSCRAEPSSVSVAAPRPRKRVGSGLRSLVQTGRTKLPKTNDTFFSSFFCNHGQEDPTRVRERATTAVLKDRHRFYKTGTDMSTVTTDTEPVNWHSVAQDWKTWNDTMVTRPEVPTPASGSSQQTKD